MPNYPYPQAALAPEPKQVRVEIVGTPTQINAFLGKAMELNVEIVSQSSFRPVGGHTRTKK